jgi:hypothetical protein
MTGVGVLGGGAFGTAMAYHLARKGHATTLWAREKTVRGPAAAAAAPPCPAPPARFACAARAPGATPARAARAARPCPTRAARDGCTPPRDRRGAGARGGPPRRGMTAPALTPREERAPAAPQPTPAAPPSAPYPPPPPPPPSWWSASTAPARTRRTCQASRRPTGCARRPTSARCGAGGRGGGGGADGSWAGGWDMRQAARGRGGAPIACAAAGRSEWDVGSSSWEDVGLSTAKPLPHPRPTRR